MWAFSAGPLSGSWCLGHWRRQGLKTDGGISIARGRGPDIKERGRRGTGSRGAFRRKTGAGAGQAERLHRGAKARQGQMAECRFPDNRAKSDIRVFNRSKSGEERKEFEDGHGC